MTAGSPLRVWLRALLVLLCAPAVSGGQSPVTPPPDTIRLASGTILIGRITSASDGKIHIFVDAIGEVSVDSSARVSAAISAMAAATAMTHPSAWSGTLSASGSYASEILPGLVGATLGAQVTAGLVRTTPSGALSLDATLGYWRIEPDVAAVDQWALSLGWRHEFAPRFVVLARGTFDVNHVQSLKYRSIALAGIGYELLEKPGFSLIVAPAFGFAKSEQTMRGRVLSFADGIPPAFAGAAWGAHEMLMAQLSPALSFQQDVLWLNGVTGGPYEQLQFDARLTAMVMKHVALLITFNQQYDSSMPAPVNKTVRRLNPGIQFVF